MARIRDVVFDSRHPASLARFWAAALAGYAVAPYDEAELDRLRAAGIDDPEDDPNVLVEPSSGGAPRLWCQLVPETKVVKNPRSPGLGVRRRWRRGRAPDRVGRARSRRTGRVGDDGRSERQRVRRDAGPAGLGGRPEPATIRPDGCLGPELSDNEPRSSMW